VASVAAAMADFLGRMARPLTILIPPGSLFAIVQVTAALKAEASDTLSRGQTALCSPMTNHGRATIRPNIAVNATTVVPDVLPCLAELSEANAGDA
jgi:hypothetical protein